MRRIRPTQRVFPGGKSTRGKASVRAFIGGSSEAADLVAAILESSTEIAVIAEDVDGTILAWNEGAARLYRYEPAEVIGKANMAILHLPEDTAAGKHREIREAVLRDGRWEGELDQVGKDGGRFHARLAIAPRHDLSGRLIGFLAISHQVSDETRRAFEDLNRIRERLALMLEAERMAHFASWHWDLTKDVAEWSEAMYAIFDRDPSFVPTLETSLQIMHPDDRERVNAAVKKAIEERAVYEMEYRIVRRDGSIRFLRAFGRAHYDVDGKPMEMVGAVYDVTEMRQAQSDLGRSERRFRTLFETSVDPIVLVDANAIVIAANPAMEEVTGLSGGRLLRQRFDALLRAEDRERAKDYIRDLLAGRPVTQPFELTLAGTTERILEVRGRPMQESGSPTYAQLIARDVTERREMTRRLMETERHASIGQVASFVAHEVNNPLTNISLLTASLRKIVQNPEALEKLDRLDRQRKIAGQIVTELLDLTRARQLSPSQVDLRAVVESAVEQVAANRRPDVTIDRDLGPEPVLAMVDPLRMTQAIGNLVKNALQATERGLVRVRIERRPRELAVVVSDSGPGIPPDVGEKLFRNFVTTKRRGEGTGLGLAFVLIVVTAHGGRIEWGSESGRGATFTVILPSDPAERPADGPSLH